MSDLYVAIIFASLSALLFGISDGISKTVTTKLNSSSLFIFYRSIIVVLIAFIVNIILFDRLNFSLKYVLLSIVFSALNFYGFYFYIKGLKSGKAGVISPMASIRVLPSVIIGYFFLSDILEIQQYISIGILILGVVLTTINFKDIKNSNLLSLKSGIPYAMLGGMIWGISFPLFNITVPEIGPYFFTLILEFVVLILSGIHSKFEGNQIFSKDLFIKMKNNIFPFILVGTFSYFASFSQNFAFGTGQVSIVAAITAATPVVVIIYGFFILKEKLRPIQYLGIILIIIAAIFASIG